MLKKIILMSLLYCVSHVDAQPIAMSEPNAADVSTVLTTVKKIFRRSFQLYIVGLANIDFINTEINLYHTFLIAMLAKLQNNTAYIKDANEDIFTVDSFGTHRSIGKLKELCKRLELHSYLFKIVGFEMNSPRAAWIVGWPIGMDLWKEFPDVVQCAAIEQSLSGTLVTNFEKRYEMIKNELDKIFEIERKMYHQSEIE